MLAAALKEAQPDNGKAAGVESGPQAPNVSSVRLSRGNAVMRPMQGQPEAYCTVRPSTRLFTGGNIRHSRIADGKRLQQASNAAGRSSATWAIGNRSSKRPRRRNREQFKGRPRVGREVVVGRIPAIGRFGSAASDTCARRRWRSFTGDMHVLRDIDAVGVAAGKVGTYGGGASAFVFGLSASEFAAFVGAVVAVVGLAVQWYFNRRRDRREQAEHLARMRELERRK